MKSRFFFAKAAAPKRGEIYIYEDIGEGWFGGLSAKDFSDKLNALGDVNELDIYVNSYGGEVFAGVAIYNQLKRHKAKKTVHIDGIAASIASIIAMAGDTIKIAANAEIMIHDPWGVCIGNSRDMTKAADDLGLMTTTLVDTYVSRTKGDKNKTRQWMAEETWMDAKTAVERGFADEVVNAGSEDLAAAYVSPLVKRFNHAPAHLTTAARNNQVMYAAMEQRLSRIRRASPATA